MCLVCFNLLLLLPLVAGAPNPFNAREARDFDEALGPTRGQTRKQRRTDVFSGGDCSRVEEQRQEDEQHADTRREIAVQMNFSGSEVMYVNSDTKCRKLRAMLEKVLPPDIVPEIVVGNHRVSHSPLSLSEVIRRIRNQNTGDIDAHAASADPQDVDEDDSMPSGSLISPFSAASSCGTRTTSIASTRHASKESSEDSSSMDVFSSGSRPLFLGRKSTRRSGEDVEQGASTATSVVNGGGDNFLSPSEDLHRQAVVDGKHHREKHPEQEQSEQSPSQKIQQNHVTVQVLRTAHTTLSDYLAQLHSRERHPLFGQLAATGFSQQEQIGYEIGFEFIDVLRRHSFRDVAVQAKNFLTQAFPREKSRWRLSPQFFSTSPVLMTDGANAEPCPSLRTLDGHIRTYHDGELGAGAAGSSSRYESPTPRGQVDLQPQMKNHLPDVHQRRQPQREPASADRLRGNVHADAMNQGNELQHRRGDHGVLRGSLLRTASQYVDTEEQPPSAFFDSSAELGDTSSLSSSLGSTGSTSRNMRIFTSAVKHPISMILIWRKSLREAPFRRAMGY
ncbi:unnamed protein product [Amoebophrya sp. A25]|nr:unnamed protein product [Amoebophrya sp. A25]|eukprot:GSA25T00025010001.1